MRATHLSLALLSLLDRRSISAAQLAAETGVNPSTISRATAGERIAVETLRALCTKLADPKDGLLILTAHLSDEANRAGRSESEVRIEIYGEAPPTDFRVIEDAAQYDADLRQLVHHLANVARRTKRARWVAEDDKPDGDGGGDSPPRRPKGR